MADAAFVGDVMACVRNYFETDRLQGSFTLHNGRLDRTLEPGTWVALAGAGVYSGVYRLDDQGLLPSLPDFSYEGSLWLLAPTAAFLRQCEAIAAWVGSHPRSGVKSETLGEYSYSLFGGSEGPVGWPLLFANELMPFRRMVTEVKL